MHQVSLHDAKVGVWFRMSAIYMMNPSHRRAEENIQIKSLETTYEEHLQRMRWAGHVAHTEVMRNTYNILVRKPGGKRPVR